MNEKELIELIKLTTNSDYIGDDCAYLEELGIVISQDSLVEDIHFSLNTTDAYKLGWKSAMVNISDVCASGAKPLYMTVSLSIPEYLDNDFVKDFYKGLRDAADDVKVVGGDITGSSKLFISIAVIGSDKDRKISSRKNAKIGYKVIVSGEHGNSGMGLKLLTTNLNWKKKEKFLNAHLMPVAKREFSKEIAENITVDYAMMDTSDGLADALLQIAKSSNVRLSIKKSNIPHDNFVNMDMVLYGGEDYELVAVVPDDVLKHITHYYVMGEVVKGSAGVEIDGKFIDNIDSKVFNHFKS